MALVTAYTNIANATTFTTPASLPNLILYLDADTTFSGAAHNDVVSSWTDLSGNAYHQVQATAGFKPKVQKTSNTSPSGKVLVRFDGIDDFLSSVAPATWPSFAAGYTLYFYGRLMSSASFAMLWSNNNTNRPQIGYEKAASDKPYVRTEADGTAVKNLHSAANIFDTKMQLFAIVFGTGGQGWRMSDGRVFAPAQELAMAMGGEFYPMEEITTGAILEILGGDRAAKGS